MGLFDFSTGSSQADSAIGGIFSGLVNRATQRLLPAGALSPDAAATVARPSLQGQPSVAPQATYDVNGGWKAWIKKPVVWIIAGVVVVLLAWKLFAKPGK